MPRRSVDLELHLYSLHRLRRVQAIQPVDIIMRRPFGARMALTLPPLGLLTVRVSCWMYICTAITQGLVNREHHCLLNEISSAAAAGRLLRCKQRLESHCF